MVNVGRNNSEKPSSNSQRFIPLRTFKIWMLAFLATTVISFSLFFIFWNTFQDKVLGYVGYGLGPVISWILALLITLIFRPRWIWHGFRFWLISALLIASILIVLSLFHIEKELPNSTTMGGSWGARLSGSSMFVGLLWIVLIIFFIPIILIPKQSLRYYWRGSKTVITISIKSVFTLSRGSWRGFRTIPTIYSFIKSIRKRPRPQWIRHIQTQNQSCKSISRTTPTQQPTNSSKIDEPYETEISKGDRGDLRSKASTTTSNNYTENNLGSKRKFPVANRKWDVPSLDLLIKPTIRKTPEDTVRKMATQIETTLGEHGVEVTVENIKPGPRVIRFGLVPGWTKKFRERKLSTSSGSDNSSSSDRSRVKVHSILAREKDLALALKTSHLRLEAPVPGESLVGIEVPNPFPYRVHLHSLIENSNFTKLASAGGLPISLGEQTGGDPIAVDLIDMPHLLIAGATGSGKSVCINSIIASLLLTSGPDKLRLLMVDPKRVELTPFNNLPHLLLPVIVDTDKVINVLQGIINEMFRRYRLMEEKSVRNIDEYRKVADIPLPYLVVVIDELADLMIGSGYEVEQSLVRIAQLGRATGIHLILATQRPSVNVVTGLMKANVPSRIAFTVASQVDSRVILDVIGAEKLLGKGDMLFLSTDSAAPRRLQGTFVSDDEINNLVKFWTVQQGPTPPIIDLSEAANPTKVEEQGNEKDELLIKARSLTTRYRQISPSVLQRRLEIGYSRALHLMDLLEDEGTVAPGEPGKSREVLVNHHP